LEAVTVNANYFMSLSDSIAVLAATTPPRSKPIFNVGKANARIRELEGQVGLPPGRDFFNVGKANARVKELERKLTAAAPASPAAPGRTCLVVPANYTAGPTAPVEIAPATLTALARTIYGTDAETNFEAQRKQFTQSGLVVPGLTPAAANPHYTPPFVGLARAVRADRQSKISAFFKK
jgi:hypothetical protein